MNAMHWPVAALLLLLLSLTLVSGCSKYDALERNMQYVSSDLLRKESVVAYERVKKTHAAWKAAPGPATLDAYKEYYAQYRIIYNELIDRSGHGFSGRLLQFSEDLPPAPPGVSSKTQPATPQPATPPQERDFYHTILGPQTPSQPAAK